VGFTNLNKGSWCPTVANFDTNVDTFNFSYCACAEITAATEAPSMAPTQHQNLPPSSSDTLDACEINDALLGLVSDCTLVNGSCFLDLDNFTFNGELVGPVIPTCKNFRLSRGANVVLYSASKDVVLECFNAPDEGSVINIAANYFQLESDSRLTLDGVSVRNCAGVFELYKNSSLFVNDATIEDNYAYDKDSGPGVEAIVGDDVSIEFKNTIVRNNEGSSGVFQKGPTVAKIDIRIFDSTFENNRGSFDGGVILIEHDVILARIGSIVIVSSSFTNNRADNDGGVISISQGAFGIDVNITDSIFRNNAATGYGGALSLENIFWSQFYDLDDTFYDRSDRFVRGFFVNVTFDGNSADLGGGAIRVDQIGNEVISFRDCRFVNNVATDGAAVYSSGSYFNAEFRSQMEQMVLFHSCTMSYNYARSNGGVFVVDQGSILLDRVLMISNTADVSAGVYGSYGSSKIIMRNSTATLNRANQLYGGVFVLSNGDIAHVETSTISSNVAAEYGGVVGLTPLSQINTDFRAQPLISFSKCRILNNRAGSCGGVGYGFGNGTKINMEHSDLASNEAPNGAVFCSFGGSLTNSSINTFRNNLAGSFGGVTYLAEASRFTDKGSSFESNSAAQGGGCFYMSYGTIMSISDSLFASNTASFGFGGVFYIQYLEQVKGFLRNSEFSVVNSAFATNSAFAGNTLFHDSAGPAKVLAFLQDSVNQGNGLNASTGAFATLPAALKLFQTGSVNIFGKPTCDVLGAPLSSISTYSGGGLAEMCLLIVDGFNQPVKVNEPYQLNMHVKSSHSNDVFDVPKSPNFAISMSDRTLASDIQVFGEEGVYEVMWEPTKTYHTINSWYYNKESFTPRFNVTVIDCKKGQVRVDHNESAVSKCQESASLIKAGYYFPDARNLSRTEQCPLGTARAGQQSALECVSCGDGYVSAADRSSCLFCEVSFQLSFDSKRERCDACPENAECLGGSKVVPLVGYYHTGLFSYQFHKCLAEEACGTETTKNSRAQALVDLRNISVSGRALGAIEDLYRQAQCSDGYTGVLCGSCSAGFERKGLTECGKCASTAVNIVFFTFVFLLFLTFLIFVVSKSLKGQTSTSVASKIIIAFLQQLSIIISFKTSIPQAVYDTFSFISGISSGEITSIGCLLSSNSDAPVFMVEAVLTIYVGPVVFMCLVPLVLIILRKYGGKFGRWVVPHKFSKMNAVAMAIIVYFFMYPYILISTIKLFACITVDDNANLDDPYIYNLFAPGQYLVVDTKYECWSSDGWHRTAALGLGIPAMIIFVIGMPVCLGAYMNANFTKFRDPVFATRFGFVYVGLYLKRWYWFFAALFRTSILAIIGILVQTGGYQILLAQLWLLIYLLIVLYIRPYNIKSVLMMEAVSTTGVLVSLYLMMFITQMYIYDPITVTNDSVQWIYGFLLLLVTISTLIFLIVSSMFVYTAVKLHRDPKTLTFREVFSGVCRCSCLRKAEKEKQDLKDDSSQESSEGLAYEEEPDVVEVIDDEEYFDHPGSQIIEIID